MGVHVARDGGGVGGQLGLELCETVGEAEEGREVGGGNEQVLVGAENAVEEGF